MSQSGDPESEEGALRGFLARILGWSDEHRTDIEHALRSIQLAITYRAALVLLGDIPDLLTIAEALHRRTLGAGRPFVLCDRHRVGMGDWPRSRNHESGVAAVAAARGGSLCVPRAGMPLDFSSMVPMVRDPAASVQLIVCGEADYSSDPFLMLPVPIQVPPLAARGGELPRIVDEYARDAITTLGAFESDFTEADRGWVLGNAANTWAEIDRATLRIIALRNSAGIPEAAKRIGMNPASLRSWIRLRRLTPQGRARP
jgi:hypothetical protein